MKDLIIKKFIYGGNPVDGPSWGMTTIFHGSMRYRHNEINENRISFLDELCSEKNNGGVKKAAAGLELIHSKKIYDIENSLEVQNMQGDGIITRNKKLIPIVTVADCVPIFIYDLNYDDITDYKTTLQELIQADQRRTVTYELLETSGPSNAPEFKVAVMMDDMRLGVGKGTSKKRAEQQAAKDALNKMATSDYKQ